MCIRRGLNNNSYNYRSVVAFSDNISNADALFLSKIVFAELGFYNRRQESNSVVKLSKFEGNIETGERYGVISWKAALAQAQRIHKEDLAAKQMATDQTNSKYTSSLDEVTKQTQNLMRDLKAENKKHIEDLNAKHKDLNAKYEDLNTEHKKMNAKHEEDMQDLKAEHKRRIEDLNTEHKMMNAKHERDMQDLNAEIKKHIENLNAKNAEHKESMQILQTLISNQKNALLLGDLVSDFQLAVAQGCEQDFEFKLPAKTVDRRMKEIKRGRNIIAHPRDSSEFTAENLNAVLQTQGISEEHRKIGLKCVELLFNKDHSFWEELNTK
ncbi:hypothetical protein PROFUN_09438 [Planoprotostelium fungivorum]|uniref:Uncharacterized protein n=1 Tax=Planoprotostelium fungivorum TaxID=1890364 RepID=A0A2P6NGY9_9EUKA|nr:hypothetical protein PROFUN_09438 [Planoprotostelium fungivorum]